MFRFLEDLLGITKLRQGIRNRDLENNRLNEFISEKNRLLRLAVIEIEYWKKACTAYHNNTPTQSNTFTQEEVRKLLSVCHPDKHNNDPKMTEITKKLLQMRQ